MSVVLVAREAKTTLDRGPWRALNVLYARMVLTKSLTMADVERDGDVAMDDLIWLAQHRYAVTTRTRDGDRRRVRPEDADPAVTDISLTSTGIVWWHHNPRQMVLLSAQHRSRTQLWVLIARGLADRDAIAALVDEGMVAVVDVVSGGPVAGLRPGHLRKAPAEWRLQILTPGRRVLAS